MTKANIENCKLFWNSFNFLQYTDVSLEHTHNSKINIKFYYSRRKANESYNPLLTMRNN